MWILIIIGLSYKGTGFSGTDHVEFNSLKACEAAYHAVEKRTHAGSPFNDKSAPIMVCVKKD